MEGNSKFSYTYIYCKKFLAENKVSELEEDIRQWEGCYESEKNWRVILQERLRNLEFLYKAEKEKCLEYEEKLKQKENELQDVVNKKRAEELDNIKVTLEQKIEEMKKN